MKNWIGKIIGMLLGFFLAGPLGLIVGLIFGHLFDQGLKSVSFSDPQAGVQEVFFNTTFKVMGCVAKADGRVSENEIRQARHIMQQMGLDDNMKREAIRLFTAGKQIDFDLDTVLRQLRQVCLFQSALLRVFLEIQIQMAYADGPCISQNKRKILEYMAEYLEVNIQDQIEQPFQDKDYRYQKSTFNFDSNLSAAYEILGLSTSATNSEIKKTYRRLMSQNHPDKLIAQGLSVERIKLATQKTQKIKNAYEQIRRARGIG